MPGFGAFFIYYVKKTVKREKNNRIYANIY